PIGLALENFDVTGEWRTLDKTYAISAAGVRIHTGGIPVDAKTTLYDGTPLDGPASLRESILKYSDAFISTLTQKLYAFAIDWRQNVHNEKASFSPNGASRPGCGCCSAVPGIHDAGCGAVSKDCSRAAESPSGVSGDGPWRCRQYEVRRPEEHVGSRGSGT